MRNYKIVPSSWECPLSECPPGLFRWGDTFGLMTEYLDGRHKQVYTGGGETFWGGVNTHEERDELRVIPCVGTWEEE